MRIRLCQKREVWRLTWTGRLVAVLVAALLLRALAPAMFRGLAVSHPLEDPDYVLIEGWLSDASLAAAIRHPAVGERAWIVTTGGPIEHGSMLMPESADYARFTRARLLALGVPPERLLAAPAGATARDRTYAAALAVRNFLRERGVVRARINLISRGVHARRSALLYRRALGPEIELGVAALPENFGPGNWWKSSDGFRSVLYEWLALAYTRVFLLLKPESSP